MSVYSLLGLRTLGLFSFDLYLVVPDPSVINTTARYEDATDSETGGYRTLAAVTREWGSEANTAWVAMRARFLLGSKLGGFLAVTHDVVSSPCSVATQGTGD